MICMYINVYIYIYIYVCRGRERERERERERITKYQPCFRAWQGLSWEEFTILLL